jgi:ubiquinone/menaquinone biosynthesis C-methylase UbiE
MDLDMGVDYSTISKTYDKYRGHSPLLIKNICEFGQIGNAMRILDLGCGTGDAACQLKDQDNLDVIGLDKSRPMLEIAASKAVDVVCADVDISLVPFRDSSFDRIISIYVIHHISNLERLFEECFRVLRYGYVVLLTSSHAQIRNQHPVIKDFFPTCIDIDLARFPDIPVVDQLLHEAGFSELSHRDITLGGLPIDEKYTEQVKNKFVSTYHLLEQKEFEEGVKRLETFIAGSPKPQQREWRGTLILGKKSCPR